MDRGLYKTDIEGIMGLSLQNEGIYVISQFPIRCKYGYILDFAIPNQKIDIECDGEVWHQLGNKKDKNRDGYLKSRGWIILRFKGNDIKNNIQNCINKIKGAIKENV